MTKAFFRAKSLFNKISPTSIKVFINIKFNILKYFIFLYLSNNFSKLLLKGRKKKNLKNPCFDNEFEFF